MNVKLDDNRINVFVYGTLRPPRPHTIGEDSRYFHLIETFVHNQRPALLKEADLFDMGEYPAAVRGLNMICGDLLSVDKDALAVMDRIEGHPTFFRRERVSVVVSDQLVGAWIYWAPDGLTFGRSRIAGGDWLCRREEGGQPAHNPPAAADCGPVALDLRRAVERLAVAANGWLSSVRPDGRACSAPVPFAWRQGRAYLRVGYDSETSRNVAENPSVVLVHPDPDGYLQLEGWATVARQVDVHALPGLMDHSDFLEQEAQPDFILLEVTPTLLRLGDTTGYREWSGGEVMRVR